MSKTVEILALIGNRAGKPPGWERVVRLFASPEKCRGMPEICVVRDGAVFIAQPAIPLGWHVAFFGSYEPELREVLKATLPAGGVAIDVGANVGWHTLLMGILVGAGGRVIAAEANPSVRSRLEENLGINGFDHVQVVSYAVSDVDGHAEFYGPAADDPAAGDGHVVASGESKRNGAIDVETRRLDTLCHAIGIERLDLIKIDVEGFEWPVIQGADESIAKFRPHVVFEYIDEYAFRGGGTPAKFDAFFRKHRYRLFAIGRNWAEAVDVDRWPKAANIWAVPSK
jgi:FkbM family methyltransferase